MASSLTPLTDFHPRNNEQIEKDYLGGRCGAIPFIPGGLKDDMLRLEHPPISVPLNTIFQAEPVENKKSPLG